MTLLCWFALGDCGDGGGGGCGDDHVAVYIQQAEYPAESGCVPYLTGVFLNLLFCLILLLKGQCTAWENIIALIAITFASLLPYMKRFLSSCQYGFTHSQSLFSFSAQRAKYSVSLFFSRHRL